MLSTVSFVSSEKRSPVSAPLLSRTMRLGTVTVAVEPWIVVDMMAPWSTDGANLQNLVACAEERGLCLSEVVIGLFRLLLEL